jgi:antitoxin component YwqK of YwqJK toxin-antitoxin module
MHAPFLIALLSLALSGPSGAQRTYLSATLEPTTKGKAAFYKESAGKVGDNFLGKIYTMDGKLKAEGQYADAELNVPNGTFTFFHPNGKKESIGEYRMGLKAGVWQRYDQWGLALAEKVYDTRPIENLVYTYAPTMPSYPGGQKELVRYIRKQVGDEPFRNGDATASFVVERDGALTDVKVKAPDENSAKAIEEALAESPKWQVGKKDGVPVRVSMTVPIK